MAYLPPLDAAAHCHVAGRSAHRLHRRRLRHVAHRAASSSSWRPNDRSPDGGRGSCQCRSGSPPTRGSRCPTRSIARLRKCSSARSRRIRTAPSARTSSVRAARRGARDDAAPHLRDGPLSRAPRARRAPGRRGSLRRRAAVAISPTRRATRDEDSRVVDAVLRRGDEEMPLSSRRCCTPKDCCSPADRSRASTHGGAFALVSLFREKPSIRVPESELPALLESLYALPRRPALELPPEAHIAEVRVAAAIRRRRSFPIRARGARRTIGSSRSSLYGTCASTRDTTRARRSSIATRSRCTTATSRASTRHASDSSRSARKRSGTRRSRQEPRRFTRNKLKRLILDLVGARLACRSRGRRCIAPPARRARR